MSQYEQECHNMTPNNWQFFIDAGGTFTDVVVLCPDNTVITHKLLSNGAVRGIVGPGSTPDRIVDPQWTGMPDGLWAGYELHLHLQNTTSTTRVCSAKVKHFDGTTGTLNLSAALPLGLPDPDKVIVYELRSDEPAPVMAIRYLMGLSLDQPIGAIEVRLGTTRATNALLERKGARTAFVTTKGFRDALRIGHQDRPELFQLNIRKRDELADKVAEIKERMNADGQALRAPDVGEVRNDLASLRAGGIEAVAICLVHAHRNGTHESLVAEVAESVGFEQVSVSSRVAPLEGFVSRADTTVADAYLGPIIRGYVDRLRSILPEARIQLMTSNGGLMDADQVMGKDTILSGPAGGVVGCARIARDAGVARCIGFDMGGTSTDVCRVEVESEMYDFEHETVKAGIRLKTPMLAVETVAAGGGSVCRFDGQMLRVGPESAGAEPGPACYGRGGPLTVTDVNLYLGRIVPDAFPFRLDVSAVERHLRALCDAVNEATGSSLSPVELAQGLVRIANERMAAAIRRISAARGYDLREYALVAFGGAGGQHACALAELLGMKRALCSPYAGVLSAVGIAATSNQRIAERDVVIPVQDDEAQRASDIIEALQREAREALMRDGVAHDEMDTPVCTADVRYTGQSSTITVPFGAPAKMRDAFESQHSSYYGYVHDDRSCEMRTLRVLMRSRRRHMPLRAAPQDEPIRGGTHDSTTPGGAHHQTTRMIVEGQEQEVNCRPRRALRPGQAIAGPAIVTEDTSTVVIDAGWKATVLETGALELVRFASAGEAEHVTHETNPVQLELFHNRFAAIAEQMGAILRRTALSTNVKERLDYSCALFDADGELVANAPHIPVHLGGMSDCVKALCADVASFAPGDVYVTNDPFRGGSHLNDITVIAPVHEEGNDRPAYFVASRAHHAEIGGTRPGSMAPDAQCLDEEGIVIRAFAYVKNGRVREDDLRPLLQSGRFPSRAVEDNVADINAQVAANQTGAAELLRLSAMHGRGVVQSYMKNIRAAAEAKTRDTLAHLPSGVYTFEDALDDGTTIKLTVTLKQGTARFDFTGTDPVHPGCFNANRAIVTSAILYCLRCLMKDDIPLNGGMLAPIELVLPECFLNPPPHNDPKQCAAVGGGNVETSQRIVDVIFGALGIVAGSQGTMNNVLIGTDHFGYYETVCGGAGAGEDFHGADAVHTHMTNTRLTDVEVMESRYPMRLLRFEIRQDSGGSGRYNGGCGVTREIEFLAPLALSLLTQRRARAPYGLNGGAPGTPGRNRHYSKLKDKWVELKGTCQCEIEPGDRLLLETPGGGGYGPA